MDVLVAYEYVGDEFYSEFHCDCDWICFRGLFSSAKHALCRFLNDDLGERMAGYRVKDIREDFVIKNVLTNDEAINKFIDDYWHNEPLYQERPKRLRK